MFMLESDTDNKIYQLLPSQEGILFHALKDGDSKKGLYIIQMVIELNESLDVVKFCQAWEILLNRHDLLRSKISWKGRSRSIFRILPQVQLPIKVMNVSSLEPDRQETIFNDFLTSDLQRPFAWDKPPYIRLCVFQFNRNDQRVILSLYHIIVGMSTSGTTLLREVFGVYNSLRSETEYCLDKVKPYELVLSDLQKYYCSLAENYWETIFAGFDHVTPLPLYSKDEEGSGQQCSYNFVIPSNIYHKCRHYLVENHFTLNTFVLAVWGLLLKFYTGENDIVFGSVRSYPQEIVGNSIGLFINTLPVRFLFNKKMTILEYLHIVRQQQNGLRSHVVTPLYKIQELLGHSSLFSTVVDFKAVSLLNAVTNGKSSHIIKNIKFSVDTNYPLVISLADEGSFLSGVIHYSTSLYSLDQIKQLAEYFTTLFEQIVFDITHNINTLVMLSEKDLSLLLDQWNRTKYDFDLETPVHRLFEQQVLLQPNRTALELEDKCLTYQELNKQANAIAHELLQYSIGIGEIVGLYVNRGFYMIAGALGILKSGSAYLPLDTNMPGKRLRYLIQDSKLRAILVDNEHDLQLKKTLSDMCVMDDFCIINMNPIVANIKKQKNPKSLISPRDLAYAIYTSGTTGKPKGVLIDHRATTNMALTHSNKLNLSSASRVLQFSNPTFDASVAEWISALTSGATLCILPPGLYFIGSSLISYIESKKISTVFLTGTVLKTLPKMKLPYLHTIVVGGESCSQELIDYWANRRLFINAYGLTETTVCVTMCQLEPGSLPNAIGKPIYNNKAYVFGDNGDLLPIGAVGQLYVEGVNLARSYINDKKLTQNRFVNNVWTPNKILFKTGDLVKWLPDGNLSFIGRSDDQVKIRGFRVELDEIVHIIQEVYGVEQCVVLTHKDQFNHAILVSYVKLNPDLDVSIDNIKKHLREHLLEHMIPSVFIIIDEMPLTPHGKIDKNYLLNHYFKRDNTIKMVEGSLESRISNIWRQLLHADKLDNNENLFDLGAHSILMLEASIEIEEALSYPIKITELFQYPTVKSLATYLNSKGVSSDPVKKNNT